ncbi:MAG: GNAT family N-acetyltransferase [Acidobacteria bacterium]|nr:GNAT family N-acetyltransferase [Acidobacteriota bacterium]
MGTSEHRWASSRLLIRTMPSDAVNAIVDGRRLEDWAEDYPADGDVFIANGLHRGDITQSGDGGGNALWGHHQIVEISSNLVVGGLGFHAPPHDGVAEIGYGVIPSRRGQGYATEAVMTLVAAAWDLPEVLGIIAHAEHHNVASQRVLEKAGFHLVGEGDNDLFRIDRPR